MRYLRLVLALTVLAVVGALAQTSTMPGAALAATPEATPFVPPCARAASATPEATTRATSPATTPTASPPTLIATQMADAPLRFIEFLVGDIKFNPDQQQPFAVVMVFTLVFENLQRESMDVRNPRFALSIEGVPWGDLASTDFQTGRLQAGAHMGIVLQNLTIISKTNDAQKAVLECLKAERPVDVGLTGTLDAYPGGTKQPVSVSLVIKQIVMRSRHS